MDLNMNSTNHVVKCSGKIIFRPNRPGLKKSHRSFDNGVILKVDNGITEYYSWWLNRKFGISISKPAWGTHITIVNDRDRVKDFAAFEVAKKKFNNKIASVGYDVRLKKQWQFWVIEVLPSPELVEIRKSLGLREDYPFHITIGRDDV